MSSHMTLLWKVPVTSKRLEKFSESIFTGGLSFKDVDAFLRWTDFICGTLLCPWRVFNKLQYFILPSSWVLATFHSVSAKQRRCRVIVWPVFSCSRHFTYWLLSECNHNFNNTTKNESEINCIRWLKVWGDFRRIMCGGNDCPCPPPPSPG